MARYKIQYKPKLSKNQAKDKICAHAMFGNHGNDLRPKSPEEAQEYFLQKGVNTDILVEQCRDYKKFVPDFENLIGSTWQTVDASVSLIDSDKEVINEMKEPGLFIWSNCEAHFEAACDARDRAVDKVSYSAFQECLSQGFASIEAFFSAQARFWNKQHPDNELIGSETHKVSLEDKIEEWVPKMSNGKKIDKTGKVWNDFKILKKARGDNAIHPKLPGQGISYRALAKQINGFRLWIAQLLANLHLLLGLPVPSIIINAVHMPEVEVIKVQE